MTFNKNQLFFLNTAIELNAFVIDYEMADFEEFYGCSKEEMETDIKNIKNII